MNNSELISVIIPTFKRPDRLDRALLSVLNQTYENFEVLIINDDSNNLELEVIINKYKDQRVRLFNNERKKGANGARNTGILNAKGKYLAFLDDDDEWLPIYLRTQHEKIFNSEENTGLVYGSYLLQTKNKWTPVKQNKSGDVFIAYLLDKFSIGASSNIFIKSTIIKTVGLWNEELQRQQDIEFLIRVFIKYNTLFNENIVLKVYGHNAPDPEKAFREREIFFDIVKDHVESLKAKDRKHFLSNHYRRQVTHLLNMGFYRKATNYWIKGFTNRPISIKADRRVFLAFLKSISIKLKILNY